MKPFFSHSRKKFLRVSVQNFGHCRLHEIIDLQLSQCLSANHNPELRGVICTGVTLSCVLLMSEFHFYALSNEELFLKETRAMVHDSSTSLLESRDLFKDIIVNPEKTDDHDCNETMFSEFIESN